MKKQKTSQKGITLIALVITIIILLILAGVTISLTVGQNGILNHATNAVEEYGKAATREKLEIALADGQMRKHTQGLSEDELDNIIESIGGELLPKEDSNSNNQQVIVDGHIFEIDRSVPKIIDYVGPADGIVITASVSQNGNWQNPVATVTGKITKYGGGSVTSSTATAKVISTGSTATIADFPTAGGNYSIENITEDIDITIIATDSEGHDPVTRTIQVRLVRDNIPPTLSNAKAEVSGMKIKISVNAEDNEGGSGLSEISYTVSPNTVTPQIGTINSGEIKELTTSVAETYTITFTAIDNAKNLATATATATTVDVMSLEELKNINSSNYSEYIGKKVDYNPTGGGTWRVFYVEDASNTFRDGTGTIYLKRDYKIGDAVGLRGYVDEGMTENGLIMMKKLNPMWREYTNSNGIKNEDKEATSEFKFEEREIAVAGLLDTTKWENFATGDSKIAATGLTVNYAIGSAPVEMWCKVQNAYRLQFGFTDNLIKCGIMGDLGYGYGIDDAVALSPWVSVEKEPVREESSVLFAGLSQWIASPSGNPYRDVCAVHTGELSYDYLSYSTGICPVVSIKIR